ncbi:hypothetical protein OGAPHI_004576 [Ogataea philodendri]|uniref:Uncharacterized protein n=1 Tax=Ogataea philodendri TaxID=1378263 RepID=A0A9P8P363_9ASCO|nr:uncharacterized protein OGAPHI_004576 [Ogataea philodendri]KAH3664225.1 hypothetical protein OGAPHI_004576 [Ogataea philodendri]
MPPKRFKQSTLTDSPSYVFSQMYGSPFDTMFPVVVSQKELHSKDGIDFTSSHRFEANHIQKYRKPLDTKYNTQLAGVKKTGYDPVKRVFAHYEEDKVRGLRFGVSTIRFGNDGKYQLERVDSMFPDTPMGSKRSIDSLEPSFDSTSPSPIVIHRLGSLKKRRHDRLDNSMTISQRGILRMVDDSLVSSDTEFYTSILQEVRPQTSNIRSIRKDKDTDKENVMISAEDLKMALLDREPDTGFSLNGK